MRPTRLTQTIIMDEDFQKIGHLLGDVDRQNIINAHIII